MIQRYKTARAIAAGAFLMFCGPAFAEVMSIKDETPSVTVDVPDTFKASQTDRGLQAKTPDEEVFVWFETYAPEEVDALINEHNAYWAKNGVTVGDTRDKAEKEAGGKTVIATDYKDATWQGKPTVIRYLFIDAALPSKKLILMSLWASPEGDKSHDGEIMDMIGSLKIKD